MVTILLKQQTVKTRGGKVIMLLFILLLCQLTTRLTLTKKFL